MSPRRGGAGSESDRRPRRTPPRSGRQSVWRRRVTVVEGKRRADLGGRCWRRGGHCPVEPAGSPRRRPERERAGGARKPVTPPPPGLAGGLHGHGEVHGGPRLPGPATPHHGGLRGLLGDWVPKTLAEMIAGRRRTCCTSSARPPASSPTGSQLLNLNPLVKRDLRPAEVNDFQKAQWEAMAMPESRTCASPSPSTSGWAS